MILTGCATVYFCKDVTMLILSRRRAEQLSIGGVGDVLTEPVVITVTEIRGDNVRIGIDAQRDMNVHRMEIQEKENAKGDVGRKFVDMTLASMLLKAGAKQGNADNEHPVLNINNVTFQRELGPTPIWTVWILDNKYESVEYHLYESRARMVAFAVICGADHASIIHAMKEYVE